MSTSDGSRDVPFKSDAQFQPTYRREASNGSSVDDYRSVIDDLTIENRNLKERLKKLEGSSRSNPHLRKDKLFEVKFHELPSRKRRELVDLLRTFVAGIDGSEDANGQTISAQRTRHTDFGDASLKSSSISTSNPPPGDSAYASMSSDPTPMSASKRLKHVQELETPTNEVKEEKLQKYLRSIPQGLMPRHSMAMTERQKKKTVVRRLEQLFTGKTGVSIGEDSQSMQQQEVSNSATRADRAADGLSPTEGVREAHILPYELDVDHRHEPLGFDSNRGLSRQDSDATAPDDCLDDTSLDQRPTRPLDLDPDRAQNPSENVDYIRHLGLSTPQLAKGDSSDSTTADTSDWIPLNLLMSMAQLHIINVTPDFVRSALQDVSEMFQLSEDGHRVRWRGGIEGTQLGSDSGSSSDRNLSPPDSDGCEEVDRKRRKVGNGRFAKAPIRMSDSRGRVTEIESDKFHYKPLFHHQLSSEGGSSSFDESDSPVELEPGYGNGRGRLSRVGRIESQMSSSSSRGRQRDEGPIIFYSCASFCTDLSGDSGNIITPQYVTGVGKDGFSDPTQNALGLNPRKRPHQLAARTESGSLIPFRPFKDYSKCADTMQTREVRPKTPELLTSGECSEGEEAFPLDWSLGPAHLEQPPRRFSASGIGGTRPADHFSAKIETRRTILDSRTRVKLSKFSAPGYASRKFNHAIPKSFIEIFQQSQRRNSSDSNSSGLASPNSSDTDQELPVKIKLLSAKFSHLDPSPLPPPSGYYAGTSITGTESEYGSSASGLASLQGK